MQLGRLEDTRTALEQSGNREKAGGELRNQELGLRSSVDAGRVVELGRLTGESVDEIEHECEAILRRLGVIEIPKPPFRLPTETTSTLR